MSDAAVLQLARDALLIAMEISAPLLGLSLVVGLLISVFQAATQIQETTLTFVPKVLAMAVALMAFGPWILRTIISFATNLLVDLPKFIH